MFFAFSAFVMPALDELAPARGLEAMQAVNRTAVGPALMLAVFGTAALCLGLAVAACAIAARPGAALLLGGALVYLVGAVGVTAAANVPLNDTLARSTRRPPAARAPGPPTSRTGRPGTRCAASRRCSRRAS